MQTSPEVCSSEDHLLIPNIVSTIDLDGATTAALIIFFIWKEDKSPIPQILDFHTGASFKVYLNFCKEVSFKVY